MAPSLPANMQQLLVQPRSQMNGILTQQLNQAKNRQLQLTDRADARGLQLQDRADARELRLSDLAESRNFQASKEAKNDAEAGMLRLAGTTISAFQNSTPTGQAKLAAQIDANPAILHAMKSSGYDWEFIKGSALTAEELQDQANVKATRGRVAEVTAEGATIQQEVDNATQRLVAQNAQIQQDGFEMMQKRIAENQAEVKLAGQKSLDTYAAGKNDKINRQKSALEFQSLQDRSAQGFADWRVFKEANPDIPLTKIMLDNKVSSWNRGNESQDKFVKSYLGFGDKEARAMEFETLQVIRDFYSGASDVLTKPDGTQMKLTEANIAASIQRLKNESDNGTRPSPFYNMAQLMADYPDEFGTKESKNWWNNFVESATSLDTLSFPIKAVKGVVNNLGGDK